MNKYLLKRAAKASPLKGELGITVIELVIGLTLFFIISVGVFQLFRLGYQAVNQTSITAGKNSTAGNFSNLFGHDMTQSSGFVVSSANAKKEGICTSWNSSNIANFQDFTNSRPLLTTYVKHSAIINYAEATGTSVIYYTNAVPDFKAGQTVEINGLSSAYNDNFNILQSQKVIIQSVSKTIPFSFTVTNNSQGLAVPDGRRTNSPTGTTNNGVALTISYAGYELRYSKLIEPNLAKTELWRVVCQQPGQALPDLGASIKLRENLPPIDNKTGSNCSTTWTDWGCALKCVQVSKVEGQDTSPFSDICPTDVFLTSGNRSFTTYIGKGGISTPTSLYLSNASNTSSSSQIGMSINFDEPSLNNGSIREFITAVDLTDPSGDAVVTVECVDSSNTSSQSSATCPVPAIGAKVTVSATVFAICVLTNNACTNSGTNSLDVTYTSLLSGGMYIDFPNGYGVLAETLDSFGSQTITFASAPSSYSLPKFLQFHRPSAVLFWIPASSDPRSGAEQKVVAGRATS